MPADSRTPRGGGRRDLAAAARRGRARASSSRGCASPQERRADLRAQLAANRVGALRLAELARALRRRAAARGDRRGARLRRAAHARMPRGARPTARATREDVLEAPRGRPRRCALRATVDGERLMLDFTGSAAAARGQPQLPARGHPLGLLLRGARAHRPRHPAVGRRLPADRGARARGLRCSTRAPARRSRRATSRPPRASPTSCSRAFGRAHGQGTMNNLTLGDERFTYYETLGGGQGACADADGPSARARRDEQHAQHARSRRSSASSRCAWSSTRCAAARAARAPTAAATASCASSRRSRQMTLLADHRAPPPRARAAPHGGEPGAPGRNLLDGARAAGEGDRHAARRASGCASKRPAAADSGCRDIAPAERRSASSASGSWARGWRPTSPRAGYPLTVWTHTPGKAERWAAEHGAQRVARRRPRWPRAATSSSAWSSTATQVASVLLGERRRASSGAARALLCVDCSTIGPPRHARDRRPRSASAASRMLDAPVTGSSPRAEDGTLTIMVGGDRRGLRARAAAARDDGRADRARRRARPGPDAEADQQLARRPPTRPRSAEALLLAARAGIDLDALVAGRSPPARRLGAARAEGRRRCASTTTRRCSSPRTCSRTCACACEEAESAGVPFPAAAHARDLLTATMGRGHGEDDYAALIEARRGARRRGGCRAYRATSARRIWPVRRAKSRNPLICRRFGIFAQVSYL